MEHTSSPWITVFTPYNLDKQPQGQHGNKKTGMHENSLF